jgi:urease accessory protein
MVAVGLWGAFLGTPAIWILPVVFPLVMAFGGMLGVMGVPLSSFASPWFAVPSLLAGIACAVLAIISHDYRPALVKVLAFVTALVAMLSVLEGHAFMTLPVSIYIGLFLGATAAFVLAAAVARIMIEKLPTVIARIAARILSSWTAAIALMLLAFQVQKLMSGV